MEKLYLEILEHYPADYPTNSDDIDFYNDHNRAPDGTWARENNTDTYTTDMIQQAIAATFMEIDIEKMGYNEEEKAKLYKRLEFLQNRKENRDFKDEELGKLLDDYIDYLI